MTRRPPGAIRGRFPIMARRPPHPHPPSGSARGVVSVVLLSLGMLAAITRSGHAQPQSLAGQVLDANTRRGIPGASIAVPDRETGAVSDAAGRFELRLDDARDTLAVLVTHLAYDSLRTTWGELQNRPRIPLQERVIPVAAVDIAGDGPAPLVRRELPMAAATIEGRDFEPAGYVDAADLLRATPAVQVEESLSGRKEVALRGGAPDEVAVLYNGVRLNSSLDNRFDLSLIDLDEVARLEIVRGSASALYGGGAFSGVINVVPRWEQDYSVRFRQRVGSYDSGDWGLHAFHRFGPAAVGYRVKRGGARRELSGDRGALDNAVTHHSATVATAIPGGPRLFMLGLFSDNRYDNRYDQESIDTRNQLLSVNLEGEDGWSAGWRAALALRRLEESRFLTARDSQALVFTDQQVDNDALSGRLARELRWRDLALTLAWQGETARLDYRDVQAGSDVARLGVEAADLERRRQAVVGVAHWLAPTGEGAVDRLELGGSIRHDRVTDIREPRVRRDGALPGPSEQTRRSETTVRGSTLLGGAGKGLAFSGYLTLGGNVRFPTLQQQLATVPSDSLFEGSAPLAAERNAGLEIGVEILRETRDAGGLYGWRLAFNYFRNSYENKLRTYYALGVPVAFYDAVKVASSSGVELQPELYLWRKKIALGGGLSRYFFSDRLTFPFRYDTKSTLSLGVDHAGVALRVHAFHEGEQVALFREQDGGFARELLPAYGNVDVHLSGSVSVWGGELTLTASLRNLLDDDLRLEGLALRDRRYYIAVAIQY